VLLKALLLATKSIEDIWRRAALARIRAANPLKDGNIARLCPTRGECTRHWQHNEESTKMSQAYERASLSSRADLIEKLGEKIAGPTTLPDQFWL
jgi:hypothetical protein